MKTALALLALLALLTLPAAAGPKEKTNSLEVGAAAPAFTITDTAGKKIDLAELTAKGPVLVRLTCGCLGCDLELPYYQALHEAYKDQGLTSLAVFAEPDDKFAEYVKTRKLDMRYALDPDRKSWEVFGTKTMPSNFLIDKGGKIVAISKGCNPDGLKAMTLGEKAATLVAADEVDLTATADLSNRPDPKAKAKAKPAPQE